MYNNNALMNKTKNNVLIIKKSCIADAGVTRVEQ